MPEKIDITLTPNYPVTVNLTDVAGSELVFFDAQDQISIELQPILRGEKGDPGSSLSRYVHTQSSPSSIWTVAHNLNAKPSVTVADHLGNQIFPDVAYVDANIVQITHGVAITGAVFCN